MDGGWTDVPDWGDRDDPPIADAAAAIRPAVAPAVPDPLTAWAVHADGTAVIRTVHCARGARGEMDFMSLDFGDAREWLPSS